MAAKKTITDTKTSWAIRPQNEGQEMNFSYRFVGTQTEALEEMQRVVSGLSALFNFTPTPGSMATGKNGDFSCKAEGTVGKVIINLDL